MRGKDTFRNIVPMQTAKAGYIVLSAVLFLMGLFLLIFPRTVGNVFADVLGIAMILFGIIKVIGYFSKDLFRLAFQYDLAFGTLIALLGIAVMMRPDGLLEFLCMVIGIMILSDGLFKIQMAMDARQFGINKWWLILSFAVIAGTFGALLVFNPAEGSLVIMRLVGVALMAEGIMNLVTVLTAVKIVKHQKKDVLEGVFREL